MFMKASKIVREDVNDFTDRRANCIVGSGRVGSTFKLKTGNFKIIKSRVINITVKLMNKKAKRSHLMQRLLM